MPRRLLTYGRNEPARSIVAVIAVLAFFAGLFIATPFYDPIIVTSTTAVFSLPVVVGGLCNAGVGAFGLWAVRKNTPKHLADASFVMFLWYVFTALSRVLTYGFVGLNWVAVLAMALVGGIIYLNQRDVERGKDA